MKRVAGTFTESFSKEEPSFKERRLEQGFSQVANYFTDFFPREIRKCIFLYSVGEDHESPLALGQVNTFLNLEVNGFIREIIEKNHREGDDLYPFVTEILPNFKTSYFPIPNLCYLYSLKNPTDPICLKYKEMFEYYLKHCIDSWAESGFAFQQMSDSRYHFSIKDEIIKLDTKKYSSILILNRFFARYFLGDKFISEVENNRNKERVYNLSTFIANHNFKERYLKIIEGLVIHFYRQGIPDGDSPVYLIFLARLVSLGVVDANKAQKLKDLAIAKISDNSPMNIQLNAITLIRKLLEKGLEIQPKETEFLRTYAITKLSNESFPLTSGQMILEMLSFIIKTNELLELVSLKFLQGVHDFAISIKMGSVAYPSGIIRLYGLFLSHPDPTISMIARKIYLIIGGILPDERQGGLE